MHRALSLTLCLLVATTCLGSPAEAVAAARRDAASLPADQRQHVRYLTTYAVDAKERGDFLKALAFHVNSLSREADLAPLVVVTPTLLRLDTRDFGWKREVWEKLGDAEPYFHAVVEVEEEVLVAKEFGNWFVGDTVVSKGTPGASWRTVETRQVKERRKVKRFSAAAPWLPTDDIASLITLTQSQAPVVRADWFFVQTAIQEGRKVGYYDFLDLGNKEADFQKLIAADVAAAKRVKKEIAAVIARSGVTLNNRSMYRVPTITGPYWFTQDFKESTAKKNALRLLDGDTEPPAGDASEQYGTLPNGLFAFWLQNDKGERQNVAPDFIASDGSSSGTDRRVHVGKSCIVCHAEGIRPLDDWARKVYRGAVTLQSPDYEKFKRLRQLYLSDLEGHVRADQAAYAAILRKVNGLTPAENARGYARAWDVYAEQDLLVADAAREIGVTGERLLASLKVYAKASGSVDPILAGLLQEPAVPVRREHWEEIYGAAAIIVKGYQP